MLREQKGVTYGASSSLDTARGAGLVTVSTAVRVDATAEAVADIVDILRAAATGGLTDDEVSTGVRAATESAPLGFERADAVAAAGRAAARAGTSARSRRHQPREHPRGHDRRGRDAAYRSIVSPDQLTFVVVADAATVERTLARLGLCRVVGVDRVRHLPLEVERPTGYSERAALTTSLASSWTWLKWSVPRNDSA